MLLNLFDPNEIIANGTDVLEVLPSMKDRFICLRLPPWEWRPGHYSHILARKFKEIVLPLTFAVRCPRRNHISYIGPVREPMTKGQRHKAVHGYHCALVDAFELLTFHLSRTETRHE